MLMNKKLKAEAVENLFDWATSQVAKNAPYPIQETEETIVELTKKFQREHDLVVDGVIGPMTYSRLNTWHESTKDVPHRNYEEELFELPAVNFRVDRTFYDKCHNKKEPKDRKQKMQRIVTHWDACLNADSCIRVLLKRAVSTHFVIDNDGSITQLLPVNKIAYHASGHNDNSIGIDISNAYYLKYADWYKRNIGERPQILSRVHRSSTTHLGWYPCQLTAYKELCLHLCNKYGIEVKVPLDDSGCLITTVIDKPDKWKGIMCHYHLTTNKIDCQGLELDKIFKKDED